MDTQSVLPRMHMVLIWTMRECDLLFVVISRTKAALFLSWMLSNCSFGEHITYFT